MSQFKIECLDSKHSRLVIFSREFLCLTKMSRDTYLLLLERKGYDVNVFVFRVSKVPQTLDELGDSLALWEELDADKPKIEAKFQPLYDQVISLRSQDILYSRSVYYCC